MSSPSPASRASHLVAYGLGGLFSVNAVPHLVHGVSGSPFQSPFATPPGEGLSTAMVNVVWALVNLAVAYLLLRVGRLELRRASHIGAFATGFAGGAVVLALTFARLHGGL